MIEAYLDIETTGLSRWYNRITVVGMYLVDHRSSRMVQFVGEAVSQQALLEALEGVSTLYTYNGSRFDLPFLHAHLDVDLEALFHHHDLMYDCWRNGLKGGLKAVERQLGISRELAGLNGFDAVLLWRRYKRHGDEDALALLLEYNKEDVVNLKVVRERLLCEDSE